MAHHFNDNIYTKSFTPREYQIELLDAAKSRNIICCLATSSGKVFIATKLVQELANSARRPLKNGGKRTFYLADSPSSVALQASYIRHLTDLSVGEYNTKQLDSFTEKEWKKELVDNQVLVMTSNMCLVLLRKGYVDISCLNLMVLDECHHAIQPHALRDIISEFYVQSISRPRLLGLTAPLLNSTCEPSRLEAEIRKLEEALHSEAETASDIVSILRYCNKPKEIVVECGLPVSGELDAAVEREIALVKEFLDDHRYDPSAEYDEAYIEELAVVPDPKIDPYRVIEEFLDVLHTLGPFCADRAAFVLLLQLEKLKVKIPYVRHFLLICMVSSVFVKIRAIFDQAFEQCNEKERIYKYSSPKILRLLEVLRQFKPPKSPDSLEAGVDAGSDNLVGSASPGHRRASCEISSLKNERTEIDGRQKLPSSCDSNLRDVIDNKSKHQLIGNNCKTLVNEVSASDVNFKLNEAVGISKSTPIGVENGDAVKEIHNLSRESRPETVGGFVPRSRFVKYRHGLPGNEGSGPGRPGGRLELNHRNRNFLNEDANALCGIVFVKKPFTAKILFQVLSEVRRHDEDLAFLSTQFTVDKIADPVKECHESEVEHRKQEEVLKRFRIRECNLLVATSVLEEGIDVPKCNLVVRCDLPTTYRSYVQSKGRAKAGDAHFVLMADSMRMEGFLAELAQYMEIEQLLLRKCANREPLPEEEQEADKLISAVESYSPKNSPTNASVNMSNAVALVNRYCAKLPSDTFTRLTPWWTMSVPSPIAFTCAVRLPINSPLKREIVGPAMPSRVLARRSAALQVCRALHEAGELDDNLLPVGKESFRLHDADDALLGLDEADLALSRDINEPRPGTTKRRQYYYKRIASSLTECRPLACQPAHLYFISMVLTCPLPEEQNTRGRRIYPPEESPQGFGILTRGAIPKVCPFPIFTRSGEVSVRLELADSEVQLTDDKVEKIVTFLNYTFTSVLRLQKYLMMFDPQASENSYFVVPTRTDESGARVDWDFLDRIYAERDFRPHMIPEADRTAFAFDPPMYNDAVIMPWYRNQDQPQYFYVAEICNQLSPKSKFPGQEYDTFDEYYATKYGIRIQNTSQPLLDVDHTSARLNFLTPRYVNRKGVALPTSSEETKRAKRENLEQKQILVPELCTVHPFPASLWRKAVCLPCILYRINALLLADEVRRQVARDIALGQLTLRSDFEWPPLDFGWSLADVLSKSKGNAKVELAPKSEPKGVEEARETLSDKSSGTLEKGEESDSDWMEIGTWSNEMAVEAGLDLAAIAGNPDFEVASLNWLAPTNNCFRYGSPSSWVGGYGGIEQDLEGFETDDSDDDNFLDKSESSDGGGLRIHFKGNNEAEAVEDAVETAKRERRLQLCDIKPEPESRWDFDEAGDADDALTATFQVAAAANRKAISANGMLIRADQPVIIVRNPRKNVFNEAPKESEAKDDGDELVTVEGLVFHKNKLMPMEVTTVKTDEREIQEPELIEAYPEIEIEMDEDIIDQFSFDRQPDLSEHPGPSPSLILQALTMSNANDGINLERLETIGDSFLKYAITTYLYCTYENIHEGKLSHLRSKQVSNLNLYRLGRRKVFGESMIATKFEPHDNWLPPCYFVPRELEQALIEAGVPASLWNQADLPAMRDLSREQICSLVRERSQRMQIIDDTRPPEHLNVLNAETLDVEDLPCFIPYNLITQHSIPDKSIADCVEALIGAYLIATGPRGALVFMAWLGICVLPKEEVEAEEEKRPVGSVLVKEETGKRLICYGHLCAPKSPLLRHIEDPERELNRLLDGYEAFERRIAYRFRDRSYLLQALTHASYAPNRLTDCYQRLEFLGDAVLDYLITRHLYEDARQHSPGALTDLRSALVNNTIFASLAVRFGFHKYFRHLSPGLNDVVDRFVRIQEENGHTISEEYYLIEEEECEEAEDVEVPKALGDVFESVAGAIFLDSAMSLDAVWRVYYRMMKPEIEQFSTNVPKSPIRDLLELEPETAKFGKPEKLADGRRVRVTVEVFGKGVFKGIGRNYRIAKCTAAKCALKALKKKGMLAKK